MIILLLILILACLMFGADAVLELIVWLFINGLKLAFYIAAIVTAIIVITQVLN